MSNTLKRTVKSYDGLLKSGFVEQGNSLVHPMFNVIMNNDMLKLCGQTIVFSVLGTRERDSNYKYTYKGYYYSEAMLEPINKRNLPEWW